MLGWNKMLIIKRALLIYFFFVAIITPSLCFAHGDKVLHFKDFIGVFNGYGDNAFRDFSYTLSTGIDSTLPKIFRDQIGTLPGNHRVLGHGWALNDAIPRQTLDYLSKTYPGREGEIASIWRTFARGVSDEAVAVTGLPKAQANAFASFLYDIHLLGDVEPGNKLIDLVLPPQDIVKNINKDARILFKNNSKYADLIEYRLAAVMRQMKGKDPQLTAQALMDELYRLRVGDMLKDSWGKTFKPQYSIDRAIKANERLAQRTLDRIPGVSSKKLPTCHSDVKRSDFYKKSSSGKTLHAGLLTCDGRLLLAVKESGKTALMIIAIEGGIATYQYITGGILKSEFEEKMIEAVIKGTTVGTAVGVSVLLGATPGGLVVFAVGAGAYFIVDEGIAMWREHQARRYININDLAAYGIRLDTTLDLPQESIFSTPIDSTLELPTDSTLELETDSTLSL